MKKIIGWFLIHQIVSLIISLRGIGKMPYYEAYLGGVIFATIIAALIIIIVLIAVYLIED